MQSIKAKEDLVNKVPFVVVNQTTECVTCFKSGSLEKYIYYGLFRIGSQDIGDIRKPERKGKQRWSSSTRSQQQQYNGCTGNKRATTKLINSLHEAVLLEVARPDQLQIKILFLQIISSWNRTPHLHQTATSSLDLRPKWRSKNFKATLQLSARMGATPDKQIHVTVKDVFI